MQSILLILLAVALVAMLFTYAKGFREPLLPMANLGVSEHLDGAITYKADAAFATRYLLAKSGSDADHVDVCGAADQPIGIATDEATAAEDLIAVDALGAVKGTQTMVASEAIVVDALVYTAAAGKVQNEPAVAGTYYLVGKAAKAAGADGDEFEVIPCHPIKLVVVAELTAPDTPDGSDAATTQTLANALKADVTALQTALATPALLKLLNT